MIKYEILDCTLRDGGYYNNWHFDKNFVNEYLDTINKINIEYVEIGFRFLNQDKYLGPTPYSKDSFVRSLKIPKNLKLGVMINASELINQKKDSLKVTKNLFYKKTINFIRIACHFEELYKIKKSILWLKKKKFLLAINLMQISEVKFKDIKKICNYCNELNIDILYLADSLGSLGTKNFLKIINIFKKYFNNDLGIHAHNNLGLALKNSIAANKNGVKWIDSTVNGMGRGAGNLKTEDIIKSYSNKKNLKIIKSFVESRFNKLKKKYKWGKNKYYELAGKYKIHPTYIQDILTDSRYKNTNYKDIINNLKSVKAKKYDPFHLITSLNFYKKKIDTKKIEYAHFRNKDILILGGGPSVKKNKKKIQKFIKTRNLEVVALNNNYYINQDLIKLRVFCHPLRILSLLNNKKDKFKSKILLPYSSMSSEYQKKIYKIKKKIIDYGIKINNQITVKDFYCQTPYPLAIIYCLCFLLSAKVNKIYITGFDGYNKDDAFGDKTKHLLKNFLNKFKKTKLINLN